MALHRNTPNQTAVDPSPAEAPPLEHVERYHLLPLARLAANLDIVSIHVGGPYLLRGMGLAFFFLLTFTLAARRRSPKPFWTNTQDRFGRLMAPWLFWSSVHWLVVWAAYQRGETDTAQRLLDAPAWALISYLWFLPFIYLCEVLANPTLRSLRKVPNACFVPVSLLLGVAAVYLLIGTTKVHHTDERVLAWWAFGIPAVFFGAAIGRLLSIQDNRRRARFLLLALILCLWWYYRRGRIWHLNMDYQAFADAVLGSSSPAATMGALHWVMCRYVLAMIVLLAALQWKAKNIRPLTYLGSLTIGIYILHFTVREYADLFAYLAVQLPGLPDTAYHNTRLRLALVWIVTACLVAGFKCLPGWKRFA